MNASSSFTDDQQSDCRSHSHSPVSQLVAAWIRFSPYSALGWDGELEGSPCRQPIHFLEHLFLAVGSDWSYFHFQDQSLQLVFQLFDSDLFLDSSRQVNGPVTAHRPPDTGAERILVYKQFQLFIPVSTMFRRPDRLGKCVSCPGMWWSEPLL